jgi:hypothetical protein
MKKMFTNFRAAGLIAAAITAALLLFAGCEQVSVTETETGGGGAERSSSFVSISGGGGGITVRTVVIIRDADGLRNFAERVTEGEVDLDARLIDDIDLENDPWTPIGKTPGSEDIPVSYTGTFDGKKYAIRNLNVTETTSYAGLFALNNGTIQNLVVEGTVTVTKGDTDSIDYVAGVAAYNDIKGVIQNVISRVTVNAVDDSIHNIGGIAGFNGWDQYNEDSPHYGEDYQTGGLIYRCRNEGDVSGGFNKIGGIAGENAFLIRECVNTGTISCAKKGSGWPGVGGIVGRNGNNNTATEDGGINYSYNRGTVGEAAGGSSGQNGYGGITGWCNQASMVTNCYTIGDLTPRRGEKNPIIGMADSPTSGRGVNNYYLEGIYTSTTDTTLTGTSKDQAYMQSQAFVDALNVRATSPVYTLPDGGGYPVLTWEEAW